jgi:hypothetical protein
MPNDGSFKLTPLGQKIEGYLPEANCNRCEHFQTCGIWRSCAGIEQQFQIIKLTDMLKLLPRVCPQYSVKTEVE